MASKGGKTIAAREKAKAGKMPARAHAARKPAAAGGSNPLLGAWATPFGMPPFDRIKVRHFMPAFDKAFADNIAEIGVGHR